MEPFDEYVSLGFNCEVAWQVRRIVGSRQRGHFLDWCSTSTQGLIGLLEDRFAHVHQARFVCEESGLLYDRYYRYRFHDRSRRRSLLLARRFLDADRRRCYLWRPAKPPLAQQINELWNALTAIDPQATVVMVKQAGETCHGLTLPDGMHERTVAWFAPLADVSLADEAGWEAILSEFPLVDFVVEPARDAGAGNLWLKSGMEPFDEYVSLGFNCETALQIRRAGQERAHFFDWTNATARIVSDLLGNGFKAVQTRITEAGDGTLVDLNYRYRFYGPADDQKRDRLIYRFQRPSGRRCYLLKVQQPPSDDILALTTALDGLGKDFTLLLLHDGSSGGNGAIHAPNVENRSLRRFAPLDDAQDAHLASWDAIFAEFRLTDSALAYRP